MNAHKAGGGRHGDSYLHGARTPSHTGQGLEHRDVHAAWRCLCLQRARCPDPGEAGAHDYHVVRARLQPRHHGHWLLAKLVGFAFGARGRDQQVGGPCHPVCQAGFMRGL